MGKRLVQIWTTHIQHPAAHELEAAYKSAMAGSVKPPMICKPEGFYILGDDGKYVLHGYDPKSENNQNAI
jgi:hypothetical protein